MTPPAGGVTAGHAAVDRQDVAGDEARRVAGEEERRADQVLRLPSAPHRRARQQRPPPPGVGGHRRVHGGREVAWRERVDADPMRRPLARQLAGQALDGDLRGDVRGDSGPGAGLTSEDRAHQDHPAAAPRLDHRPRGGGRERRLRADVDLHDVHEGDRVLVLGGGDGGGRRVQDDAVEAPERMHACIDQRRGMAGIAQIGRPGDGPSARGGDLLGQRLEAVGAPGSQQHRAAGVGQPPGHDRPQAVGGPGDDRGVAVQAAHRVAGTIRSATAAMTSAAGRRMTRSA